MDLYHEIPLLIIIIQFLTNWISNSKLLLSSYIILMSGLLEGQTDCM